MAQRRKNKATAPDTTQRNARPAPALPPYYQPSTGTGFTSLPAETIVHILYQVQCQVTGSQYFAPLSTISKQVHEVLIPLLYDSVIIENDKKLAALVRTLAENPSRGLLVKELIFSDERPGKREESDEVSRGKHLGKALASMTNLKILRFWDLGKSSFSEEVKSQFWTDVSAPLANIPTLLEIYLVDCTVDAAHFPRLPQVKKFITETSKISGLDPAVFPSLEQLHCKTNSFQHFVDWSEDDALQPLVWSSLKTGTLVDLYLENGRMTYEPALKILSEDANSGRKLELLDFPLYLGRSRDSEENGSFTFTPGEELEASSDQTQEPRNLAIVINVQVHDLKQVPRNLAIIKSFIVLAAGEKGKVKHCGIAMTVQGTQDTDENRKKVEDMIDSALGSLAVVLKTGVELQNYWGASVSIRLW